MTILAKDFPAASSDVIGLALVCQAQGREPVVSFVHLLQPLSQVESKKLPIALSSSAICGLDPNVFAKLALPIHSKLLMNRVVDWSVSSGSHSLSFCREVSTYLGSGASDDRRWAEDKRRTEIADIRMIFRPSTLPHAQSVPSARTDTSSKTSSSPSDSVVSSISVVLLQRTGLSNSMSRNYGRCVDQLTRALIQEEVIDRFLTRECSAAFLPVEAEGVSRIGKKLRATLVDFVTGISKPEASVSLLINGCIHLRLSLREPVSSPSVPSVNAAFALMKPAEELQKTLPLDSVGSVRRLIAAYDPQLTLRDYASSIDLPISTVQRLVEHLLYWNAVKTIEPVHKHAVLTLNPHEYVQLLSAQNDSVGRTTLGFGSASASNLSVLGRVKRLKEVVLECTGNPVKAFAEQDPFVSWTVLHVLCSFTRGFTVQQIKDDLVKTYPKLKVIPLLSALFEINLLSQSQAYLQYAPHALLAQRRRKARQPTTGVSSGEARFIQSLTPDIRNQFASLELSALYERLGQAPVMLQAMLRLISDLIRCQKMHSGLAITTLAGMFKLPSEDINKAVQTLSSFEDGCLIPFSCDDIH